MSSINPRMQTEIRSSSENSYTDKLLIILCDKKKSYTTQRFGFLGSFFVVHLGGSIATVGAGIADTLSQLVLTLIKFATGFFISPLNSLRKPFITAKGRYYAPNWGWTAAFHHLKRTVDSTLNIPGVFFRTLFSGPHNAREAYCKQDVNRENNRELERQIKQRLSNLNNPKKPLVMAVKTPKPAATVGTKPKTPSRLNNPKTKKIETDPVKIAAAEVVRKRRIEMGMHSDDENQEWSVCFSPQIEQFGLQVNSLSCM